jgi:hypothetical protein
MKKCFVFTGVAIILFGLGCHGQQKTVLNNLETYQVSGTITGIHIGTIGLTVSRKHRDIYLFFVSSKNNKKEFYTEIHNGEIINPKCTTDDSGRFVIDVPNYIIKKHNEFTIGTDFEGLVAARREGELLTFTFKEQKKIDLGEIKLR